MPSLPSVGEIAGEIGAGFADGAIHGKICPTRPPNHNKNSHYDDGGAARYSYNFARRRGILVAAGPTDNTRTEIVAAAGATQNENQIIESRDARSEIILAAGATDKAKFIVDVGAADDAKIKISAGATHATKIIVTASATQNEHYSR